MTASQSNRRGDGAGRLRRRGRFRGLRCAGCRLEQILEALVVPAGDRPAHRGRCRRIDITQGLDGTGDALRGSRPLAGRRTAHGRQQWPDPCRTGDEIGGHGPRQPGAAVGVLAQQLGRRSWSRLHIDPRRQGRHRCAHQQRGSSKSAAGGQKIRSRLSPPCTAQRPEERCQHGNVLTTAAGRGHVRHVPGTYLKVQYRSYTIIRCHHR